MRYLIYIAILFLSVSVFGQIQMQQVSQNQNKYQLAGSFYQNKEYDKAAPLYLELYESTNQGTYFNYYINCLIFSENYSEAEKVLKKSLRKDKDLETRITLGFLYKQQGRIDDANKQYDQVIDDLKPNQSLIISTANSFFNRGEFAYAEKVYLKGRELIPGEEFRNNIATVYAYQRNYEKMMDEYLLLIKDSDKNTAVVQARLSSLLRYDFDNTLRSIVKRQVLLNIQQMPDVLAFNRLLIWLYVQENNYTSALAQAIALDKRTKMEEANILLFANGAAESNLFDIALKGLNYLMDRKPVASNIAQVKQEKVRIEYKKYISTPSNLRSNSSELISLFESVLNEFGYTTQTADIARNYSHLQSFYLNNTDKAFEILDKALASKDMDRTQYTLLRIELADLDVYAGYLWEAALLYAQIIDANKNNTMGDEVKLKKARLSYFLGNIEWAKGQLDVLKASTSKLTANNAMELSMLIANGYEMDTIVDPIQMFARADLLLFMNKDSLANNTLDSLIEKYPAHPLNEYALMRKALIREHSFDFAGAIAIYKKVVTDYSFSSSADDALYKLAVLTENYLKDVEKAKEYFKQLMVSYPGSIYVADSREKFREMRGDNQPVSDPFNLFGNDIDPNFGE